MTADSAGDSGRLASARNERYAALVSAVRPVILNSYSERIDELYSPIPGNSQVRELAVAKASEVLGDVLDSVLVGEVQIAPFGSAAGAMDRPTAESGLSPADWLSATGSFVGIVVGVLTNHLRDDPDLLPCFTVAVLALNASISKVVGEAVAAHMGSLLDQIRDVRVDERRRIARDLHDRLGERLSVGMRQLDLQEIAGSEDPLSQAATAREVLAEAMQRLRLVTLDLREEPVMSLQKALIRYLDSAGGDACVHLRVSGDETWAPPATLDETFLILREAIRNALKHGVPGTVLINVDLTPCELRASVQDDGRGFTPGVIDDSSLAGTGLTAMYERAATAGGSLTVSSAPGRGTKVRVIVPLPGISDEQHGLADPANLLIMDDHPGGSLAVLERILPPEVVAVETFADDHAAELFPGEAAVIAGAVEKRRLEFTTARACARAALTRLGEPPVPILPGLRGAPQWPEGIAGSITHCDGYRAAGVARIRDIATLGLDAEPNEPLPDGVFDLIALDQERDRLAGLDGAETGVYWERVLFSAKESVYKAWFPLARRWLDFAEAEIAIDPLGGTFTARLLVPGLRVAGSPVAQLHGRWLADRELVLTAIAVPGAMP